MTSETPLISVVVPVYGVEAVLEACLDAILAQTYENLEIILVDDGSPDQSGAICDRYAKNDARIRVIHKANGGLSDARNVGLDHINGAFVTLIDSDDVLHPQYMELLLDHIGTADFIFCDFHRFPEHSVPEMKPVGELRVATLAAEDMLKQIHSYHYPTAVVAWNKLYRAELWYTIRYPKGKIHEDEFVIHQLLDQSLAIKHLKVPLYYYRQRDNSIMGAASGSEKALLDKLEAFSLRRSYFLNKGMSEQVEHMNNEILYRCQFPSVPADNGVWKAMNWRSIVIENQLSKKAKGILLLKKICYPLYRFFTTRNKRAI